MRRTREFHKLNFRCKRLLEEVERRGGMHADEGNRDRLEFLAERGFLRRDVGPWSGLTVYKVAGL